MGKNVTIKPGFTRVILTDGVTYDAGDTLVLSDLNVSHLTAGMTRAVTIGSTAPDPPTPGGLNLSDLDDVDDSGKADGEALFYETASGKWESQPVVGDGIGAEIDDAATSSGSKVWSITKVKAFFTTVDDADTTSSVKTWSIQKLKAFFPVVDDASSSSTAKVWSIDKVKAFFPVVDDAASSSAVKVWSVDKVIAFFLAKYNNVYSISDPTNQRVMDVNIVDDSSASSGWLDRLRFKFNGVPVGWFNEYGELRGVPAKVNTVAARWFSKYNNADTAHDSATPVIEVVLSRDVRTNRWKVMPDGSTVQSARSQIVTDAAVTMEMAWMPLAVGASLPGSMPTYPVLIVRT